MNNERPGLAEMTAWYQGVLDKCYAAVRAASVEAHAAACRDHRVKHWRSKGREEALMEALEWLTGMDRAGIWAERGQRALAKQDAEELAKLRAEKAEREVTSTSSESA